MFASFPLRRESLGGGGQVEQIPAPPLGGKQLQARPLEG